MKAKIITARRSVDFPWAYGLSDGTYEMSTGKRVGGGYFSKSSYAYACMVSRGTELAGLPWRITRNDKVVENHPLQKMLTEFGPESNYAEAVEATEIDMLLCGQAFWLRDIDILKRLNPTTIQVVKDRSGIQEFTQTIDGTVVNRFPREEVVYFREYNPDDDLGAGIPAIQVIKPAVDMEYQCLLYIRAFFKNDATPSLLLSTEQSLSQVAYDKLKRWWNATFKGSRNAHKVGIVDQGIQAQLLSHSLKDNAVVGILDQARNDICVGMRVPQILIGAMEKATYANAQEARKFLIEDVIIPRSTYYADVINHDLVQQVDSGVRFEFTPEQLPILQEVATAQWELLSGAVDSGVINEEFAREQMGWPETASPGLTSEQETMRAWRRKSLKAIKAGHPANVEFETDQIAIAKQFTIRAALTDATTVSDVGKAFR